MKRWLSALLLFSSILFSFGFSIESKTVKPNSGQLFLQLKNIRNKNGVIYVFLYNYENQYPKAPLTYYKVQKSNMKNGYLKVKISDVTFNYNYAITLIDDENDNEDLDRILGIPTEGFGFSNNIRPIFSLPKYNELLFNFNSEKTIPIDLQYFL
ncbi:MAG: DUF2141 domain-containing protein [Crocinitomicaceae bacterium]